MTPTRPGDRSVLSSRLRRWAVPALIGAVMLLLGAAILHRPVTASPTIGEIRYTVGTVAVPGSFVVVLRDHVVGEPSQARHAEVDRLARRLAARYDGHLDRVYDDALDGFAARLDESAARRLAADPAVAWVEQDHLIRPTATQEDPPWGLDRIDSPTALDRTYRYTGTGTGVRAYVVDSGIRRSHAEFGGRAVDCTGHGTHAAGTIGGRTFGVAKDVTLVAVRVHGCTGGSLAQLVDGIDWVTGDHLPGRPAVANLSLSGSASATLDAALAGSIADGVTYAVAAGNADGDACRYSPGALPAALTVGAVQQSGLRATFSNHGACVDLHAPGVGISSAWHTGDTASHALTGTSSAAPFVAGAAARLLGANPGWSPGQVHAHLIGTAATVPPSLRLLHLPPAS
jgi:subtilisin family serine protease